MVVEVSATALANKVFIIYVKKKKHLQCTLLDKGMRLRMKSHNIKLKTFAIVYHA